MKELEIKKPIGDFIIKNAKGTQTENGVYYHYSEVCTLLKSYEKQLTLTDVSVNEERVSVCGWCRGQGWIDYDMTTEPCSACGGKQTER